MNIYATRVLTSAPVFLFAFASMVYALTASYMDYKIQNQTIGVHVDKVCVGDMCESESPLVDPAKGKFLMAMYIIMLLVSLACFGLYVAGNKYYSGVGIVALVGALTLIIAVPVIVSTSTYSISFMGQTMKFSPTMSTASILVLIACIFIVIKQFFNNRILHSLVGK